MKKENTHTHNHTHAHAHTITHACAHTHTQDHDTNEEGAGLRDDAAYVRDMTSLYYPTPSLLLTGPGHK